MNAEASKASSDGRWLLLIHQLPPKPGYFRVKIGRHLQRIGAVAVKNSVYALPATDRTREDFAWVYREIVDGGAEASVCEAKFVAGLSDARIEALFCATRDADYAALAEDAHRTRRRLPRRRGEVPADRRVEIEAEIARLRKRLSEITAIDFFGAKGHDAASEVLRGIEARLLEGGTRPVKTEGPRWTIDEVQGRTWVTRRNVHVDRIASAWLIRRFIDPAARFLFVDAKDYECGPGELRFDMFEAEFTHEGDCCTFEVLLKTFGIDDPALHSIAEIIHDIDLKDAKFQRPERPGVDRLIHGIVAAEKDDETRIRRAAALLSDLHGSFSRNAD